MKDSHRVQLKKDSRVFVDGVDTNWTWVKTSGFHPQYKLHDEKRVNRVSHYKRSVFVLKVLDFHNGTGEFA